MQRTRSFLMLLLAGLLVSSAFGVQAQDQNETKDDHKHDDSHDHDEMEEEHREMEKEEFLLKGAFHENRTDEQLKRFHAIVSNFTDDYEIMESFPEQFLVEDLTGLQCRELRQQLSQQRYVVRLSDCVLEKEDDHDEDDHHENETKERDEKKRMPQGKALGHDVEWRECKQAAGDNETAKKQCHDDAKERADERHDAIKAARDERKIGGQLNISKGKHSVDNATGVQFKVETAEDAADADAPALRVEVDADLDRGQTIVLDVDADFFEDPDNILIQYLDVADDGTETVVEEFAQASSLTDVLNPDDDNGLPEYWLTEDADGLHVMVSIPHWSVHAITMDNAPDASANAIPNVTAGLLIGALVVMASVLWVQRPGKQD